MESRINKASQVFRSISRLVWYQPKIKLLTKLKLFKAVILPTLLYGSKTWNLLQHNIQRLQVFVNRCLRIIPGFSLWEKIKNTQLLHKANIDRVDVLIQKRRLQWLGHVKRMHDDRLPKKLLVSKIRDGKRLQGGQKQRCHDLIHADLKEVNKVTSWKTEARNRKKWRTNIYNLLHDLNARKESTEKAKKDFARSRYNSDYDNSDNKNNSVQRLSCMFPGCKKIAANKAGLANHVIQRHRTQESILCQYCGLSFKRQGIHNHQKKCSTLNPSVYLPHGG